MAEPRGLSEGRSRAAKLRGGLLGLVLLVLLGAGAWLVFGSGDESGSGPGGDAGDTAEDSPMVALADDFTTEQLVDQVLLVAFDGTDGTAPFLAELRERQLGGVLIRADNWFGPEQGTALTTAIREAGKLGGEVPPLVAASQEGGPYRSFADLPPEQTELEIGDEASIEATEQWAEATGAALADAGIDLNLFPVADVATLDSAVADRAFSDDPLIAAQLTAAAMRGCRAAEIICAPLHFPGLGAAAQDTSRGPATVSLDAAALAARDLEPFRAAIAERARALVLSLALYVAYDPVTPGALAEPVATGLLRDELGFEGVAISDDLGSGAVRSRYSVPDAAVAALQAGADMVQIGNPENAEAVRDRLLDAVDDGTLSEERLREAAIRVLELKRTQDLVEAPE